MHLLNSFLNRLHSRPECDPCSHVGFFHRRGFPPLLDGIVVKGWLEGLETDSNLGSTTYELSDCAEVTELLGTSDYSHL